MWYLLALPHLIGRLWFTPPSHFWEHFRPILEQLRTTIANQHFFKWGPYFLIYFWKCILAHRPISLLLRHVCKWHNGTKHDLQSFLDTPFSHVIRYCSILSHLISFSPDHPIDRIWCSVPFCPALRCTYVETMKLQRDRAGFARKRHRGCTYTG